jgi:hypothetical protein
MIYAPYHVRQCIKVPVLVVELVMVGAGAFLIINLYIFPTKKFKVLLRSASH